MNENSIMVAYGNNPLEMTEALLHEIKPEQGLKPGAKIGLKPNLVVGKPASAGATTHPEIAAAVIRYFQARGYDNLCIMEGSWLGEETARAFRASGFQELADKYRIPLLDLKADRTVERQSGDLTLKVCASALSVDYLINLPVLKAHCQTKLTCALKNLKGCIPDGEKRRYHGMGLHKPIAHLAAVLPTHLTIVDGICGDLTFEEGGNPVPLEMILAGRDPVLIDAYAAARIGLDVRDVPYILLAGGLGVGTADLEKAAVTELNPEAKNGVMPQVSQRVRRLAAQIDERGACSACYGSLIHALHRLDEEGRRPGIKGGKIMIGQGFRGMAGAGPGIGLCTRGLDSSLPGCPPTALEVKKYLQTLR